MAREREEVSARASRAVRTAPPKGRMQAGEPDPDRVVLSREQLKISRWLKKLKFRRVLFGGVSEQDVWKRMNELNSMYEVALAAERARCDALIEQARSEAAFAGSETPRYERTARFGRYEEEVRPGRRVDHA